MINMNQVCLRKNMIQPRWIKSISINTGCYVRTMDHIISVDESETVEIQTKTMVWAGDLMELFRWATTKSICQAILGLRTKYNGKFDTSKLFKVLDQVKPTKAHWTFMSPAAMIGITLAIFCIGLLIWKKCDNPQALLAPPMQMPITNFGPTN